MKLILIFLLSMMTMSNCSKEPVDDELTLRRFDYYGDALKIAGYFYHEYDAMEIYIDIYFLYRNGVILYAGSFNKTELLSVEEKIKTLEWIDFVKTVKHRWGVFLVEGDTLQFERWYPSEPPLKTYIREGNILNDTTFHITESYRMVEGKKTELRERDEMYHYHAFSPKLDSTNTFIP